MNEAGSRGVAYNCPLGWESRKTLRLPRDGFSAEDPGTFAGAEFAPASGRETTEIEFSDSHTNESQRGMPDRGGHFPDLMVFAFDKRQGDPAILHVFPKTDWRIALRHEWLRSKHPCAARKGFRFSNRDSPLHLREGFWRGDALDLRPVGARVGVYGIEQAFVQKRLIAEEQ